MRWRPLLLLSALCVPVTASGASGPIDGVARSADAELPGCYLNFKAGNKGHSTILIDIQHSRIKPWSGNFYSKIKKTSNQNIHPGQTRRFGIWARSCGLKAGHWVNLRLKQGPNSYMDLAFHFGSAKTTDLGDLSRFFD